jgi:hypothetical protein
MDFGVKGSDPVHFLSARLIGVPDGMRVLGIYAHENTEGRIGSWRDLREQYPNFPLHPVTDVVLKPGPGMERWYLLAEIKGERVGTFTSKGLEITYEAGGRKGTARYDMRAMIEVTREPFELATTTTVGG